MFNQHFFRDEDFDHPIPLSNDDRVFNDEYEVVTKPNAPPVKEPECGTCEKMVKAKTSSICMEYLPGSVLEVACGHIYHTLCHRNSWILYYKNHAAYRAQKTKFLDEALKRLDEENGSGVEFMSADNRARALVKAEKFAKPVLPVCAVCRSPTTSEGGKIRENFVNNEAAKESNAKLSEEKRKKRWRRYTKTANRRNKKRMRTEYLSHSIYSSKCISFLVHS